MEFDCGVRCLQALSADNQHSSTFLVRWNVQVTRKRLLLGAHDRAKSRLADANQVKRVTAVVIDHLKLESLRLLKGITHRDARLEVRVEVVIDRFRLGDQPPLVRLRYEFVKSALRVRLAEHI